MLVRKVIWVRIVWKVRIVMNVRKVRIVMNVRKVRKVRAFFSIVTASSGGSQSGKNGLVRYSANVRDCIAPGQWSYSTTGRLVFWSPIQGLRMIHSIQSLMKARKGPKE